MNPWTSISFSQWRIYFFLGERRNNEFNTIRTNCDEWEFYCALCCGGGVMEKQSRWSEQRSEQHVQQQHTERREQVVQQEERVQRTEHHYTRQMLTEQRGQFPAQTLSLYRALTHHTTTLFTRTPLIILQLINAIAKLFIPTNHSTKSHSKLRAPSGRSSASTQRERRPACECLWFLPGA